MLTVRCRLIGQHDRIFGSGQQSCTGSSWVTVRDNSCYHMIIMQEITLLALCFTMICANPIPGKSGIKLDSGIRHQWFQW